MTDVSQEVQLEEKVVKSRKKLDMSSYFKYIEDKTKEAYEMAKKARASGKDPEKYVDIPRARDLAEKSVGLVTSVLFPELGGIGIDDRVRELEKEYGKNDERVAFVIGKEIAQGKFYKFETLEKAVEAGIRIGLSYLTQGVVTAPLEGIGAIKIRKNDDGTDYLAVYYAGPIRSAGGTASAMSVLLADYVRKEMGIDRYKPRPEELERYGVEVEDYYTRVTKKQYTPTREEVKMIAKNVPIEITGTPTEKIEVSNFKDLARIETNVVRGGMCLVYLDGLPLKAPKIKKRVNAWGKDFGLEHWNWIKDYLKFQESLHSVTKGQTEVKYKPNTTYLQDLVAGRPVFAHPGAVGGFRLRYGHSRTSGIAATSMHPATMEITNGFIAIGTQVRTEYPGKATVPTPCDSIEPPVVKLKNGNVLRVETRKMAKEINSEVKEILSLGDTLIPYGEFLNNGKKLLPSGYVEEWWAQEVRKVLKEREIPSEQLHGYITKPYPKPSVEIAFTISEKLGVPLHPYYTYWWHYIIPEEFMRLYRVLRTMQDNKLPNTPGVKAVLEKLLVCHTIENEQIVLEETSVKIFTKLLDLKNDHEAQFSKSESFLQTMEQISNIKMRNKAPTFLGSRMGRPEKSEKRMMKGRPQLLFPCGKKEGGRMRNLMSTYEIGYVNEDFLMNYCPSCNKNVPYFYCPYCNGPVEELRVCSVCGKTTKEKKHCGKPTKRHGVERVNVRELMDIAKKNLGFRVLPELLKSPRATMSKHNEVEPIEKGLLRQKYGLFVNKDGTIRFDSTDLAMTHFKPKEVHVSIDKLKELGYTEDINEKPLTNEEQILLLKPQDIVITDAKEFSAADYLYRISKFVDELLVSFYGQKPFYNFKNKYDVVGQLVLALAPHTSAAIMARVIGFTSARGTFGNPYWHCAKRRNCVPGNTKVLFENSNRAYTKSLESIYNSSIAAINYEEGGVEFKEVENKRAICFDLNKKQKKRKILKILKIPAPEHKIKIITRSYREFEAFPKHLIETSKGKKRFLELRVGDELFVPEKLSVSEEELKIDLLTEFESHPLEKSLMVRDVKKFIISLIEKIGNYEKAAKKMGINKKTLSNYIYRNNIPFTILKKLLDLTGGSLSQIPENCKISVKRDKVVLPRILGVNESFFRLIGYYLAEGSSRCSRKKGAEYYQVGLAFAEKELQENMEKTILKALNITASKGAHALIIRSRIVYELFKKLDLGKNAHEKRIPDMFKRMPVKDLKPLLSSYFAGDGSIEKGRLHISCCSVSKQLIKDLSFCLSRFGIFCRFKNEKRFGGGVLVKKNSENAKSVFESHSLHIRSNYAVQFGKKIGFALRRKQIELEKVYPQVRNSRLQKCGNMILDPIKEIQIRKNNEPFMYDIEVEQHHNFLTEDLLLSHNCDGDEDSVMLLGDALLNFSRTFLPDHIGGRTMDAPLILATILDPEEVDDESWNIDSVSEYPLEFYEATLEYKNPGDVKIKIAEDLIREGDPFNFEYTHETSDINDAPVRSAYVSLGEMSEKVRSQLGLATKIRATNASEVAELLLRRHFLGDIKGNLRKFSRQTFRCVKCNEKYRRPPLKGVCLKCGGKLLLTVSEGNIKKYLEPSEQISKNYHVSNYMRQQIAILRERIQSLFGKEDKQFSLGHFTENNSK